MDPRLKVAQWRAFADDRFQIAEAVGAPVDADVPKPSGPRQQLRRTPEACARRPRVAIARTGNREVHGQHQRLATGLPRAVDHACNEAAVLHEIELVPWHMSRS